MECTGTARIVEEVYKEIRRHCGLMRIGRDDRRVARPKPQRTFTVARNVLNGKRACSDPDDVSHGRRLFAIRSSRAEIRIGQRLGLDWTLHVFGGKCSFAYCSHACTAQRARRCQRSIVGLHNTPLSACRAGRCGAEAGTHLCGLAKLGSNDLPPVGVVFLDCVEEGDAL